MSQRVFYFTVHTRPRNTRDEECLCLDHGIRATCHQCADYIYLGFYINLPVGAVAALLLISVGVPENYPKPPARDLSNIVHALDLIGFAIVHPMAIMFFMALEWGGQRYAWGNPIVIGLLVGAGLSLMLLLNWKYYQGDNAMIPLSILCTRILAAGAAYMSVFFGVLFCFDYYFPIFFQSVEDDTAFLSGVRMLPQVVAQVSFTMASGVVGMYSASSCLKRPT